MNISAENTYTDPKLIQSGYGWDVAVGGTFVATVVVELAKDPAGPWFTAGATDTPDVLTGIPATAWYVRAGIPAGSYTSGTAVVEVY